MTVPVMRLLFGVAAAYDFLIGLVFLFAGRPLLDAAGIPHPNHWGYLQFGSLMLIVFGVMFFTISRDPIANRNLMPYGMLLKSSYIAMVGYYLVTTGCPFLFQPFAVIDLVMLVLFALAYFRHSSPSPSPVQAS